jgi:hypothetical protein
MLPILREIEQAAIGCWSIVRGSEAGAQRFDLSIDGFWRSFYWAFVLAILDTLDAWSAHAAVDSGEDGSGSGSGILLVATTAIASFLTFCLFPVIVGALAKPMGLTKPYATYIIVRNWLTMFLMLPVYVIDGLTDLDILPEELRAILVLILVVATLFASMRIARVLLSTSRSLAIGFALLDFLLALLIGEAATRLIS